MDAIEGVVEVQTARHNKKLDKLIVLIALFGLFGKI
jgi:hypothetical protein